MGRQLGPNGQPSIPPSGVILGGREYRITIGNDFDQNLKALAVIFGQTPHAYAKHLLEWSIKRASWEYATATAVASFLTRGFVC